MNVLVNKDILEQIAKIRLVTMSIASMVELVLLTQILEPIHVNVSLVTQVLTVSSTHVKRLHAKMADFVQSFRPVLALPTIAIAQQDIPVIIAKLTLACRIHAITVELVLLEEVLIYVNVHQVTKAKLVAGQSVNPVIYVKIRALAKPSIPVMVSYAIA